MLKIYTEHQFLNSDNRRKVFPLLFDLVYVPNSKTVLYYGFTDSISEADIAIFPVDIISFMKNDNDNFLKNWIQNMSENNIPIWVYAAGDFGYSIENENVTTFRLGGFDSKIKASTLILPSFVSDPYDTILENQFSAVPKSTKPNIGFVGNANGSFVKLCKEFALYAKQNIINIYTKNLEDYHPFYPSSSKRYQLLQKLIKEDRIENNFILRDKYRAKDKNAGSKENSTLEFFKNIQDNLYVFCLRGNGNFSVRFYETLIMGRIPVLVNTDVRLPLSDEIDWEKHCLLVSEDSIINDLLNFHTSKTDLELKEMQNANRKLMLERLNRVDYFIQLRIKKNINK
ncbi:exostosin family protein [Flavobacterium sp. MC2016-06]|jgi:hypothetical protein|uniref:exostosin domain-containing protein n=1 Tax=Flavobacterium sp. MC2016-06 TaxID=2676308 RepID=UPI0012BA5F29|nr:exostosin family protein [Flavobacterium sp. MC2016-06]MBU3858681.1 glycosyltransferase family 47 protein [Flavobacterium sp. MC2016-06]